MTNKPQSQQQTQQQPQIQSQSQPQPQPQPQQQVQSQQPPLAQVQPQNQYPSQTPQPIINHQTILALNYLQTHLLGGKNNILENQAHMISDPPMPSNNNEVPPYPGPGQNDPQYNMKPRDNYYGGDQRGNRGDYRDGGSNNRGYNNANNQRDFHQQRSHNGPNDYDSRPRRNMNYSGDRGASYEKSRSRSNEKTFAVRPTYNSYQKDGYKNRNGHYKEHQSTINSIFPLS